MHLLLILPISSDKQTALPANNREGMIFTYSEKISIRDILHKNLHGQCNQWYAASGFDCGCRGVTEVLPKNVIDKLKAINPQSP